MEVVALARASLAMNILVLNAGSSSLKFQLIATDSDRIRMDQDQRLLRGEFESIGGEAVITLQQGRQPRQRLTAPIPGIPDALKFLVCWMIEQAGLPQISSSADIHAVGHRVVHGGERFTESVLVTEQVVKGLDVCANVGRILGRSADGTKLDGLVKAGKLGKKSGSGFYTWVDGRAQKGTATANATTLEKLGRDLVEPLVVECEKARDEGVVANADLVDAGVIFGTGFAPFRGGPLQYRAREGKPSNVTPLRPAQAAE